MFEKIIAAAWLTYRFVSKALGLADHFANNAGDATVSSSSSGASDLLELLVLLIACWNIRLSDVSTHNCKHASTRRFAPVSLL